ncbi:hypothetical protein FE257_007129 [Aspergillus nanangensis]|uniref:Uncharacterized protein n=1 Tax=Aspergillus nanangensis TaxID=2582783 RepID=A0AAD4CNA5_ASPNN|nr:hypothetical protein FE257_007129 [Aspergillus nanangensis]
MTSPLSEPPSKRLRRQTTNTNSKKSTLNRSLGGSRKRPRRVIASSSTTEKTPDENDASLDNSSEALSSIVTRYKLWRRAGSPHDALCYEGWHTDPPLITPPPSPGLNAIGRDGSPGILSNQGIQASEQLIAHARPPPVLGHPQNTAPDQQNSSTQRRAPRAPPTGMAATARKSRFNTLPSEVDTALWVVYRELEGVPLLRQSVSDLESQVARLRQENNIQRNELALCRGATGRAQISDLELQKLRTEAAERQAAIEETAACKALNQQLQLDRDNLRSQLETTTKTLDEWKQKLSSLLGE